MLPSPKIQRVLVVKPSSLGDIFHTFPAIELLGRQLPQARLDWLVHPAFEEALKFSPVPVRRAIRFERRRLGKWSTLPAEFVRLAATIRQRKYDLIIDFQGLFRSALFGFLARGGGRLVGFASPRETPARLLYRRKLPVDMKLHAVERNVALVNQLFNRCDPVPEPQLPRNLFPLELPPGFAGKPLIGLAPGARWESKRFPAGFFAAVFQRLLELRPDCRGVIIGSESEYETGEEIRRLAGSPPELENRCGKTGIGEMIELIGHCNLVISNDSGPAHVAAAMKVPVIGLFGSTNPKHTGLYGGRHRTFQRRDLSCIQCLKRRCPSGALYCHELNPAEVAAASLDMLAFP